MTSEPTASRKPRRVGCGIVAVIVLVLAVGLPWACSSAQQAAWDANSGTQTVRVVGDRIGDGYEISETATVETWAEHNETAVYLPVRRTDDSPSRTPLLAVEIGENGNRCETARSWIWSTDEGSTLTMLCLAHVDLERLQGIETITLVPYSD